MSAYIDFISIGGNIMKKKVVSLMLVLAMTASMTACGGNKANSADTDADSVANTEEVGGTEEAGAGEEAAMPANYEETSAELYDAELGDFWAAYQKADEAQTVSERFALQAIAEAKLMESAVMLPLQSKGGNYAITRVAPYTIDYTLWGNDMERFHNALVTTDLIKASDISTMRAKWAELKGTGEYEDWARSYLESQGYTIKDTYNYNLYNQDPTTWDVLSTSQSVDNEVLVNTYDGLMEYDGEGTLQPALAESYEVSDDGLTYTFHLRDGISWVDSQGRAVADLTADDFVAGMQHMMDAQGGLEYLIEGIITNASEYISGEVTDFSQVGVEAVDDNTLVYHLEAPCSYFTTMLGYGVFAPMSRTFYESMGGKFGVEYDPSAADYTYGKDPDSIAYCGPYVVKNFTSENTIVFQANESYWNADGINIHTLTWLFNDGSDATKTYNDTISGTLDGTGLNSAALTACKADGYFDDYAYVSLTDATTYQGFFNINRNQFANTNDATKCVSEQTEEDAARTKQAMQNVHFRRAVAMGLDRGTYMAQTVGDDLKYASMRNSYTPGNFVSLEEETTVDINGTATTYPAGTYYGQIIQDQIDADGVKITVWDPTANEGAGSSDGYDGWYSPENAMEELNQAVEELAADGLTIDAENPIQIDLGYPAAMETFTNRANSVKQSIEASTQGLVQINLVAAADATDWYYSGYYMNYGYEMNYDFCDLSGWGPDYGDPSTYLDTFQPEYAGYMIKSIGIY